MKSQYLSVIKQLETSTVGQFSSAKWFQRLRVKFVHNQKILPQGNFHQIQMVIPSFHHLWTIADVVISLHGVIYVEVY